MANIVDNNNYEEVPLSWLEDDSYAISYALTGNPETEGWISFHDYISDHSIRLNNQDVLQFYNGELYQHNIGQFGVFFNIRYDSSITPVFAPYLNDDDKRKLPFVVKSFNWNADVEDSNVRKLLETWSSISVHNSFQGTRQIPIVLSKEECSLLENYGNFNTQRVKNRWYYNYVFNEKASTLERTWKEDRDKFLVINVEDKGCLLEELYRTKMIDDYIIVKLVFHNLDNRKLFHYELMMDFLATTQ